MPMLWKYISVIPQVGKISLVQGNCKYHPHQIANAGKCMILKSKSVCGVSFHAQFFLLFFQGYNQHVPLQPSFGISASGFSTLASIQHCNTSGSSGRRKRSWSRAVFTNLQRKGLEKRFQLQKYITKPDRRQLAASLGLTDAQVILCSSQFKSSIDMKMKAI